MSNRLIRFKKNYVIGTEKEYKISLEGDLGNDVLNTLDFYQKLNDRR